MKKLLLSSAAVCGLAMVATPAAAQVQLELGGYFKGYGFYTDVDETTGAENRDFDIIRNTEIHFGGETTLDNGLTVGFHLEAEADKEGSGNDSFDVNESYAYFSGNWGRVNFGAEDGAAYLLQVAAPSADSNLDGIRQFVNPVNYSSAVIGTAALTAVNVNGTRGGLDYDQDLSGKDDKFTYLSPIMNGFQIGLSYVPETSDVSSEDAGAADDFDGDLGEAYEVALRYEGQFNNVGVIAGAGYSHHELEDNTTNPGDNDDDRTAWNVGLDLDIGPFGIGAAYLEDDYAENPANSTTDEEQTWVVGIDYTTGPFKLGASYLDIENTGNIAGFTDGIDSQRYAGGVVYTYGPGMTFRGSISHVEHEDLSIGGNSEDVDATSVVIGTQINF